MHAEVFGHRAACENAYADADVPAGEVRAVRRAALVVAGEVHAHRLVARENKPEARADEECRYEERDGRVAEGEQKVSDDVERHAGAYQVNQVAAVNQPSCGEAVQDKSGRNERVEPAGTADAEFLGGERDVVRDGPVGEPHEDEVRELRDGAGEEEPVERKRGVLFLLFRGDLERLHQDEADDAERDGDDEHDGVAEGLVQEHACHGARGKREVHADAKIADAFAAAARRECVDGHRVTCGGRNPETQPVHKTQYGEQRDEPERLVADEAQGECEERPEVQRLAGKRIYEESCEGPAGERTDGVERNDDARSRVVCLELLDDEHREDR